ncbi:hypothetical protein [Sphaerimonospora mesophila]|uniref:hypothetical protein n=1 Tax=Sphaerimonospora mesophila TaxID=37483 RepID=UPI0006E34AB5
MNEPRTNRTPADETPRERDWFAPPPSQPTEIPDDPSDITYSGPLPQGPPQAPAAIPIPGTLRQPQDVRVWPPLHEGDSTQPFPALRATPLASSPSHGGASPALPPSADSPSPEHPPVDSPSAGSPFAGPSPADPAAPSDHSSGGGKTGRGRRRTALLGVGAALSLVLSIGAPTWFGYNVYKYARPSDQVHLVEPGRSATWQHVSWQARLEKIPDPTGKPDTSDRQWMKAVVTRTAIDGEGAIRHGSPEVRLTDETGRIWLMEELSNETPADTEENKVGTPYRIELVGVVPPPVADQVEILLRPSISRSVPGQSVEDMMKESVKTEEKPDHVLRFLR